MLFLICPKVKYSNEREIQPGTSQNVVYFYPYQKIVFNIIDAMVVSRDFAFQGFCLRFPSAFGLLFHVSFKPQFLID